MTTTFHPQRNDPARRPARPVGAHALRRWTATWAHPLACRGWLLAAWALAHAPALRWMFAALAQPAHQVQRTVMAGVAAGLLWDALARPASPRVHAHAWPLAWASVLLAAAARLATDVHAIHAAAALLMLCALSACFTGEREGRRRLAWLAVLLLCLPVQPHVDAHLGLPLRLWTAQAVAPLLQVLGAPNVSVESIIVTENGVADVASACSGVRTLWYAAALWLCARLVWPQAARWRWWLAGVLGAVAAVGFNALRVAGLVLALHHGAAPLLVEVAHASLGLLALALVAALQWLLCHGRGGAAPRGAAATLSSALPSSPSPSPRHLAVLAACTAGLALLPAPARRAAEAEQNVQALAWPAEFQAEPILLSRLENELLLGRHADIAEKQRFHRHGVRGSLLVVQSSDWRAHHAPELCLLAQGARIEKLERMASPHGEFRVMALQSGRHAAVTWFQSGERVVPDLGARLWSQLLRPAERWSLVTLVVDSPLTPADTLALHDAVRQAVAHPTPKNPSR
jgi:exosortase O